MMPRNPAYQDPDWWTLNLPTAPNCGIAWAQNERIDKTGATETTSIRANEDRYYTCSVDNVGQHCHVQIYMVLDGHEGPRACDYAMKHLPSVLLRSPLSGGPQMVRKAIMEAYLDTEKSFFENLDPQIVRKVTLQLEISQKAHTSHAAMKMFPAQVEEIQRLDEMIKGGTTAALAVVVDQYLYISNVGDSRALYCHINRQTGRLEAIQLTVDHVATNEEEIKRLGQLGLDPAVLRRTRRLGMQQNTRSIGDYAIKGGYKDVDIISHATSDPGTAEPYVSNGIPLHDLPPGFLVLMTDGLYTAHQVYMDHRAGRDPRLRYPSPEGDVNLELAHMIATEMNRAHDLNAVVQTIVENVKQHFRDCCRKNALSDRIDDITLIIRNFGHPHMYTAPPVSSQTDAFFPSPVPSRPRTDVHAPPPSSGFAPSSMHVSRPYHHEEQSGGFYPEPSIDVGHLQIGNRQGFSPYHGPRPQQQGGPTDMLSPQNPTGVRHSQSAGDVTNAHGYAQHGGHDPHRYQDPGYRHGGHGLPAAGPHDPNRAQGYPAHVTSHHGFGQSHLQSNAPPPRHPPESMPPGARPDYMNVPRHDADRRKSDPPVAQFGNLVISPPREPGTPGDASQRQDVAMAHGKAPSEELQPQKSVKEDSTLTGTPVQTGGAANGDASTVQGQSEDEKMMYGGEDESSSPGPEEEHDSNFGVIPEPDFEPDSHGSEDEKATDLIYAHVRFEKIPPGLTWDEI